MKLIEAIEGSKKTNGPKCKVGQLLCDLPPADAVDLQDCLDGSYQHSQIANGLTLMGHRVAAPAIAKHRQRTCSCGTR